MRSRFITMLICSFVPRRVVPVEFIRVEQELLKLQLDETLSMIKNQDHQHA